MQRQSHSKGMSIFTSIHHYVDMYWTIVHAYYCLACTSYFFCTEQTAFYIMLTLIIYHHVVMFKIQIAQNNSTENKTNILGFTPTIMYYCTQMLYLFISQQEIWIITTHFYPILVALQISNFFILSIPMIKKVL